MVQNLKKAKMKKARALVLFSGGLDSILAAKILEKQGIDVTALTLVSYFFDAEQAEKSSEKYNIDLIVKDISKEHFAVVRKPRFGYGAGMNPCIDCHLLMLKTAKKIAQAGKYDFIATGEVLGQRPMSQNREALKLIDRKAGLEEKVLRPLSAKLLPETKMEKTNIVDRQSLFGIRGKSRKEQIGLAKKFEVKNFPSPAGGCILTDREYSKRLGEIFFKKKNVKKSDIDLLRVGRHFWIEKTWIILGRNEKENERLEKLSEAGDVLVEPKDIPGPTALVRKKRDKKLLDFVRTLLKKYIKNSPDDFQVKITAK